MRDQCQRRGVCRSAAWRAPRQVAGTALLALGSLLGGSFLGCGSRTMVGGAADEDPVEDLAGAGGTVSSGSGGGGPAPGPSVMRPDDIGTVLPACEPGFERSNAGGRDCTYVFGSTCYEDERVACACACRGLANSACIIDGFLDPDAPQQVRCSAR